MQANEFQEEPQGWIGQSMVVLQLVAVVVSKIRRSNAVGKVRKDHVATAFLFPSDCACLVSFLTLLTKATLGRPVGTG